MPRFATCRGWKTAIRSATGASASGLTTAANEFDAVTLRHADHYAEGEPFARATDTPMERMWRDENHEVWQAVFRPHDPRIVYAFILRAGDVTLLHDAGRARAPCRRSPNG